MSSATTPNPGTLPESPKLSVCMIVKNEEEMLPRCLRSIQTVADELIVVDTGSEDNTAKVTEDFGAKLFHAAWCDDFAAARNESIKHATGDWILQMDADEELIASATRHLKKAVLNPWCLLYLVTCDNGVRCRSQRFAPVSRLFRNHPSIRYERRYHETVEHSVQELITVQSEWQMCHEPEIVIRHYGYELSESKMRKKDERGMRIMERYIRESPNDGYVLAKLGGIYGNIGRYDKAKLLLNKAIAMVPDWAEPQYSLGFSLQKQGDLEQAIQCYKKAIAIEPNMTVAHIGLGSAYAEKDMMDEAILHYKKALDIDPKLAMIHANLGAAYGNKGMLDEEISEYQEALSIDPESAEVRHNLGLAYLEKGMLDAAISQYKRALDIKSDYMEVHESLGVAYHTKGMLDEAIAEYKCAIAVCPDYPTAHCNLGIAYMEKGLLDEAISELRSALAIDPNETETHYHLGIAYVRKGMYDEAIGYLKRVLAKNPNDSGACYNIAIAYYFRKEYKLAIQSCDKAMALGHRIHPQFSQDLEPHR